MVAGGWFRVLVGLSVTMLCAGVSACVNHSTTYPAPTSTVDVGPYLAGDKVPDAIAAAARSASGVHVTGSATVDGAKNTVDVRINKDSSTGTITTGVDGTVPFRSVGGTAYAQLTDSALDTMSGITPAIRAQVRDKWVTSKSIAGQSITSTIANFSDYQAFVSSMVKAISDSGTPAAAGAVPFGGGQALLFQYDNGDTLDLAVPTPHYLLHITSPNDGLVLDFTDWNTQVPVSPPPAADLYSGPGLGT
jgi:hypothetical protein